jgi:5'-deoxynucleotidase YfbR-like HD superfamily hydrolase
MMEEKILDLSILEVSELLKRTQRWGKNKHDLTESTADHVAGGLHLLNFAFRTFYLEEKINYRKAVEMWTVHDLQEAICGDTPYVKIRLGEDTVANKNKREIDAWRHICRLSRDDSAIADDYFKLWLEFEDNKTDTAKLCNAIDKLEPMFHFTFFPMIKYPCPESFPVYADQAVADFPELESLWRAIKLRIKELFEKNSIPWAEEFNRFM